MRSVAYEPHDIFDYMKTRYTCILKGLDSMNKFHEVFTSCVCLFNFNYGWKKYNLKILSMRIILPCEITMFTTPASAPALRTSPQKCLWAAPSLKENVTSRPHRQCYGQDFKKKLTPDFPPNIWYSTSRFLPISPDFVEAKTHDLPISRFWWLESM